MSHDDYGGLHADLRLTAARMSRREMLRAAAGGVGALSLFGCAADLLGSGGGLPACEAIPRETAGPFPADGSNGPDVLREAGVVRPDIRSSFAGLSGTAGGVPLTLTLQLVDLAAGCAPAPGFALYAWHCDREGRYSLYSPGATEQNYLRGVQESGPAGDVSFTTIFPGCYPGRWPHIHFEVFRSLAAATDVRNRSATSQLAFPEAACSEAYAAPGYEGSRAVFERVSLAADSVFRDGVDRQLATMGGDAASGLTARLTVPV